MGEHPGLARAGPGDDQQRPVVMGDGLALDGVQPTELVIGHVGIGHGDPILRAGRDSRSSFSRWSWPRPATSWSCCSTASTGTCSGATAAPSSTRPPSIASRHAACASRTTSPARCRACPPATTCSSVRSTSCGDRGVRSRCGRTRSPTRCGRRGSRRCWCPTIRTCSRPAARTTTATSPRGTTCAATRTTRGAHVPTRRGSVRLRSTAQPAPWRRGYDIARTHFRDESDFPGPRTMHAAVDWLRREVDVTDRDAGARAVLPVRRRVRPARAVRHARALGEPLRRRFGPVGRSAADLAALRAHPEESGLTARAARHLRANYGAKLSMIDAWLGRLVDTIDEHGLWDDTAVIVCTDHGHYLGEHGIWGKPAVPLYGPMMHMPLIVCWPGLPSRAARHHVDALTTQSTSTRRRRRVRCRRTTSSTERTAARSSRCSTVQRIIDA